MLCRGRILPALRGFSNARAMHCIPDLPDLPYAENALEPAISAEIMHIHHQKHHKTYVTNLKAAIEKYHDAEAQGDLAAMIALQGAIKFNGGGHVNHSIFWTNLAPPTCDGGDISCAPRIKAAIESQWGSVDAFKTEFNTKTAAIQGSGWGWLGLDKTDHRLKIATMANQDPLSTVGLVPLLGVDVWEHAYYLQYKNVRPDYLKAIWGVVNWRNVEARFCGE